MKKVIIIVVSVLILGGAVLYQRKAIRSIPSQLSQGATQTNSSVDNSKPTVVSVSPKPGDGAYITPTQEISITFNMPVKSAGDVKITFDPVLDFTIALSDDQKTVKITPKKPYEFGHSISIHVNQDTRFRGEQTLGMGYSYNFQTISYSGI